MKSRKPYLYLLFIFFLSVAILGIMAIDSDSWPWATIAIYVGTLGSYISGSEIGIFK